MTTWIATTQDDKLADRTSDIESTNATTAADLQLDGNEYQAKSGVWVSLTHTDVTTLISGNYGTVKGYRSGPMVTLRIDWKSSASGSWNTGNFGTLPESWRPPMDLNFSFGGRDGANQKIINVNANGTMTYANQGGTQGTNAFGMTVSYAL